MFWNRFFWPSFLVLIATVALHWIGSYGDYYETTSWYDVMMHFLGGLWVYLFALWVSHTQYSRGLSPYATVRNLLIFVLIVGILWELFELVMRFTSVSDPRYPADTPIDLAMDMLGALLGSLFYKK